MIKLVVFDWNGTLLSDTQAVVHGENAVHKRFGKKKVSLNKYRETATIPWTKHLIEWGYSKQEVGKDFSAIMNIFHDEYEPRIKNSRSRTGARELLEFLARNKIDTTIASNHFVERINFHLKRLNLRKYFKHTLAYETLTQVRKKRTKEERIRKYLVEHHYKPNQVIIVGDSDEEIQIGRKLGLISIAITHGTVSERRLREEKPDYVVRSLKSIIPIISKLNKQK